VVTSYGWQVKNYKRHRQDLNHKLNAPRAEVSCVEARSTFDSSLVQVLHANPKIIQLLVMYILCFIVQFQSLKPKE
jgi:hypothetical protein